MSASHGPGKIDELAKALPNLKTIKCPEITKRELDLAIPFLESLDMLSIRKSPKEDTWAGLAKRKNLKELNLPKSYSKADLQRLQDALPNVQVQVMK